VDVLGDEFARIKDQHKERMKFVSARDALSPSVTRVFAPGTKEGVLPVLLGIDVDLIPGFDGQDNYRQWFEENLERVAQRIGDLNSEKARPSIYPGYKWGHAAKILNVYVRNVVIYSRYFPDEVVERISHWLYCPIDSYIISRLNSIGCKPPCALIKDVDTAEKFCDTQACLQRAAARCGVPAVWFDDNWGG